MVRTNAQYDAGQDDAGHGPQLPALQADGQSVVVPDAHLLFAGDYARIGSDLVITGHDGTVQFVIGYFDQAAPADLLAPDGARLLGSVVEHLAGPQAPAQYAQATAPDGAKPIGIVETLSGSATATRADGSVVQLKIGSNVFQGDVVQTGGNSKLSVTFADKTVFSMSADARMVLNEFVYNPDSSSNSMLVNLVQGTFVFVAGKVAPSGDMNVTTPVATMGIRGTTVITTIDGQTVSFGIAEDPGGGKGSYQLLSLTEVDANGNPLVIGTINATTTDNGVQLLSITSGSSDITISDQTPAEILAQADLLQQLYNAVQTMENRDPSGQNTVPGSAASGDRADASPFGSGAPSSTSVADITNDNGDIVIITLDGEDAAILADTSAPPADGGDGDTVEETATLDLPEINSAPIVTFPETPSVDEDGTIILTGFNIFDPNSAADVLSVMIDAQSTVTLAQTANLTFQQGDGVNDEMMEFTGLAADINAALNGLTYNPTPNDDDGGGLTFTVSDGQASTTRTLSIDINPVNDAPVIAGDLSATVDEGGTVSITPADLTENDPDDAGDGLTYLVTSGPDNGQLELTTNPNIAVTSFTQNDLDNGRLIYVHDGSQTTSDTFDLSLADGGEDGALPDTATFDVTVTPINDAPMIAGDLLADADVGDFVTLGAGDLTGSDPDDAGAGLIFLVTGGPSNGQLELTTNPNVAVTSFTQADLDNARVIYVHDGSNNVTDSFDLSLADGGEDGVGADTGTFNITITPVNDAPVIAGDLATTVLEGGTVAINLADLTADDPDDAGTGLTYSVTGGAVHGQLELTGNAGVAVTSFTQDDLDSGRLVYVHDGVSEADDIINLSLADGGEDGASPDTADFTISITPVNDPPTIAGDLAVNVDEGGSVAITTADLTENDPDDDGAGLTYTVTGGLANGQLEFTSNAGVAVTGFTQDDLDNGRIIYVHDGSDTLTDTINVQLADGGEDGVTPGTAVLNVTINPDNDPPTITAGGMLLYTEGDAATAIDGAVDVDDPDSATFSSARIAITGNYNSDQDRLAFTNTAHISATFNIATGVLLLTGVDTIANYQAALRMVTYENLSGAPNEDPRTISFRVNDGEFFSNNAESTITVVPLPNMLFTTAPDAVDFSALPDVLDPLNGLAEDGNVTMALDGNDVVTLADQGTINHTNLVNAGGTFFGGPGDDLISGGSANDLIHGGEGDDVLVGQAGNDTLDGDADIDTVDYGMETGTNGVMVDLSIGMATDSFGDIDTLSSIENVFGTAFDDAIAGDGGRNILNGAGGNDMISGGGGNDMLFGAEGNDSLDGGAGNDAINGGPGNDDITGGIGNDILHGGTDRDGVDGAAGNDQLTGGAGNDDIDGGDGIDTVDYSQEIGGVGVYVDLDFGTATDTHGHRDIIINTENVIGTEYNDTLIGSGVGGYEGGEGNGDIGGGGGNDNLLRGEAGDDILAGHADNDILDGGADSDTVDYSLESGTFAVTVDLGTGMATDTYGNSDTLISIENANGSSFHDILDGDGADNRLSGGMGNDDIEGHGGDDMLLGDAGNDILAGGAGNDTLNGGQDRDELDGGSGDDVLMGEGANDVLFGDTGKDDLSGGDGNDDLDGGDGDDVLSGGDRPDDLVGGAGNDRLRGGDDSDMLTGGGGNDRYEFLATDTGVDIVTDFSLVDDFLDLSDLLDANFDPTPGTGNLDDYVQAVTIGGATAIGVDGDGTAGGVNFTGVATLTGIGVGETINFVHDELDNMASVISQPSIG